MAEPHPQSRFVALPFDLPPNETHAFWVDVFLPETMPPGAYRRWVWVRTKEGTLLMVPLTVTVWNVTLPRLATLKTEFGSPAGRWRRWYQAEVKAGHLKEAPSEDALYAAAAQLLSEHRFNSPFPPSLIWWQPKADGSWEWPADKVAAIQEFVEKYHVNAVPIPRPPFKEEEGEKPRIANWLRSWDGALKSAGLADRLCYRYLIDEPNDAKAYEWTRTWGRIYREAGSAVKVLVTEQPETQDPAWGTLEGAVDIWVPLFPLFQEKPAAKRQALKEEIWAYTALCQGKDATPWWHTDWPLLNYRVSAWIAWHYRMTGLLYWGGMSYWDQSADPWTDPWTYGKTKADGGYKDEGRVYNGEGTLVYPGPPAGVVGAVPSVRLKALRDAIEDYEYLGVLERAGKRAEAEAIVRAVARSWTDWTTDAAALLKARQALGGALGGLAP